MKKFTLAFCMLITPFVAISGENYHIIRISDESLQKAVVQEKFDAQYRCAQKWATVAVAAVSVYAMIRLQSYFYESSEKKLESGERIPVSKNLSVIDNRKWIPTPPVAKVESTPWTLENLPSIVGQGAFGFGQGIFDTTMGTSKWIITSASGFIGMGALSFGVNQIGSYWTYFHETEELPGFVKNKTKLCKLEHLLKEFAVPFDIYSERLSMELNFGAQRMILSDFMKEMIDAVDGSRNEWSQNKILQAMKKDFLQKTSSLHDLQDHALHAMNYRQRIQAGLVETLFEIEQFNRASMAEFCNLLILEVERITAFVEAKTENSYMRNYFAQGIKTLVDTTNIFAAQVEAKLALSMTVLYEQSKQGDGLFDLVFDYSSFLQHHIEAINLRLQYSM